MPIQIIEDIPYTYTVTHTTCTESIEVVPNEVCTFSYEQETEDTTSKTGEVTFERVVAKENTYNVPAVTPVDVPVTVAYSSLVKTCVDKPINLPIVTCNDISEERTIQVPSVRDDAVVVCKCSAGLGEPACSKVELTLPKQACEEIFYNSTTVANRRTERNKRTGW